MANKIIHKHSSVITENGKAKLPTADQLDFGELAINYASGVETISLKNENKDIVEFKPSHYFEKIILENEAVTAASLTDLDTRLGVIEEGQTIIDMVANATEEIKEDIATVSTLIDGVNEQLSGQIIGVIEDIENSESVIATALTDLNDRVTIMENEPELIITSATITDTVANASDITNNATGVVQAKAIYEYTPSRTEIEEMEYVLTTSVTDLDERINALSNIINSNKMPGTTFKITSKLDKSLGDAQFHKDPKDGPQRIHTYYFSGGNLSSCFLIPFDTELMLIPQATLNSYFEMLSNGWGTLALTGSRMPFGQMLIKIENVTSLSCELYWDVISGTYPSERPLNFFFIAIDSNGNYDIDTFSLQSAAACFLKDTPILLADNTTKMVQDINYNDDLLVWNFDEGKYDSAKPLWIKKEQTSTYYYKCTLENGTIIKLVGSNGKCHRLFSCEDNAFISATDMVGKTTYTKGSGYQKVISYELINEECEYYNIITNYHMNLFANDILTSCRYNNIYPIEDMKFVKDDRLNRAPKWKLYEQFRGHACLGRYVEGLRLYEQLDIPLEETIKYCERLETNRKRLDEFDENKEVITSIEETEVGWIDEEGNAYGFRTYMPGQYNHIILADKICEMLNFETENTSRELEKRGWVKYTTDFVLNSNDKMINRKQLDALRTFLNVPNKLKKEGFIKIGTTFSEYTSVESFNTMDEYSFEYRKNLPITKLFKY